MNFDSKYLESAIYELSKKNAFYAALIQEVNIRYTNRIPTAALMYDKERALFWIEINYEWFAAKTTVERGAVLWHEILHFVHQHIFRAFEFEKNDKKLLNIAMDMAINQYIPGLPADCVDVKKFSYIDDNKKPQPFPEQKLFELYLDLLEHPENLTEETKEELKKYTGEGGEFDVHDWFDQLSESEKRKFLEQTKDIFERTIDKTKFGHSNIPDFMRDLIQKIDSQIGALDYKRILAACIKKTATSKNRASTWNRPNKRYGVYAPGTTKAKLPSIHFFMDVSGSISYKEINECLKVIDGFLKVGENDCKLSFWDTAMRNTIKYKLRKDLNSKDITGGGTDPNCVLETVEKLQPDLTVVLTDGYYGEANRKYHLNNNILWIISKQGQVDHPLKKVGKTVKMV